jgi:HEAT repeat protein
LLSLPSWRGKIRASALAGLAELRDKRGLDLALRFAERGNQSQVRAAALQLLGKIGTDSPRAFNVIADIAKHAFEARDSNLATAAGEALVRLGEQRIGDFGTK